MLGGQTLKVKSTNPIDHWNNHHADPKCGLKISQCFKEFICKENLYNN